MTLEEKIDRFMTRLELYQARLDCLFNRLDELHRKNDLIIHLLTSMKTTSTKPEAEPDVEKSGDSEGGVLIHLHERFPDKVLKGNTEGR